MLIQNSDTSTMVSSTQEIGEGVDLHLEWQLKAIPQKAIPPSPHKKNQNQKLQKQKLRTDLRRMAKRIRKSPRKCKFHAYHWLMRFYNNGLLAINLCRLALGGQTVKSLRLLASKFELDQSQRKSTQVGGQTKRKSKTCVDLRGLNKRTLAHTVQSFLSPLEKQVVNPKFHVNLISS